MRVALLANDGSGAGGAGAVAALLERRGAEVERIALSAFCDGPSAVDDERLAEVARRLGGSGAEAARGAAAGPEGGGGAEAAGTADRVVVAGGDGSLGPAAALAARAGLPLAVVPTGTANDFARWLGLPLDPEEAAALAVRPDAPTRHVEVASANGRPFVNVATAGLSVVAARNARPLKARLGPLAYAVGALRAGVTGRPIDVAVRVDGEEAWRGRAWQVVVAATGAFGAGSETGGVDPHDGRLDVAVVAAGPRVALVRRAWAMKRGRLVHDDRVVHLRGGAIEVELRDGVRFNVDGEVLRIDPARFAVAGAVEVVAG